MLPGDTGEPEIMQGRLALLKTQDALDSSIPMPFLLCFLLSIDG